MTAITAPVRMTSDNTFPKLLLAEKKSPGTFLLQEDKKKGDKCY